MSQARKDRSSQPSGQQTLCHQLGKLGDMLNGHYLVERCMLLKKKDGRQQLMGLLARHHDIVCQGRDHALGKFPWVRFRGDRGQKTTAKPIPTHFWKAVGGNLLTFSSCEHTISHHWIIKMIFKIQKTPLVLLKYGSRRMLSCRGILRELNRLTLLASYKL